jgi:hypothetical protein
MLVDILFIADWRKLENIGSKPIVTPTVKTKIKLIMTTRWSKSVSTKQWYPPQSRVQVSERALANNVRSYEWNNQGSMQK